MFCSVTFSVMLCIVIFVLFVVELYCRWLVVLCLAALVCVCVFGLFWCGLVGRVCLMCVFGCYAACLCVWICVCFVLYQSV